MHYYDKVARAQKDLLNYLDKDPVPPFSVLVKKTLGDYGFGTKRMIALLEEIEPRLTVMDDKVVKRDE